MEIYYHIIIYGTIFLCLVMAVAMLFLFQYQKKHKNFIDQQNNFQQTLLQSQLEIQEKTLNNISQEIHDNIGQVLSLVKLNLYTMDINDQDALSTKIDNSKELVSKAITDLRDLSHSMNTDYIEELGLVRAIEHELEMIRRSGSHQTSIIERGKSFRLDQQKELIIFRMVQEALQNIIKHAQANSINIVIDFDQNSLNLHITDNGVGISVNGLDNSESHPHNGINNMHSRAKLLNAFLEINSGINSGTTITIKINTPNL